MVLLAIFAFIAGIVTILSPCILPVLPILLSGSVNSNKNKAFGIVAGFVISFSFITLFFSSVVRALDIPGDFLRIISIVIIFLLGVTLLIPQFQAKSELLFAKIANLIPTRQTNSNFIGGVILGLGLGVIWTPCVGPILASVITLAAASQVTLTSVVITLAYSLGTAIPMLIVIQTGGQLLNNHPWLRKSSGTIQKVFGLVMIFVSIMIYFNLDRQFQTFILSTFPKYGSGLTQIENNDKVKQELNKLQGPSGNNLNLDLNTSSENQKYDYSNLLLSRPQAAPEIIPGGQWFNLPTDTQTLKISELRGKVVLVDFWTYTCINCIRTLPYLKSWHDKYKDRGLVIIGVHTPEFEFEKEPKNVLQAIDDFKIEYPIVQDNNYSTWNAYSNRYWPAKYFIDKNGQVRAVHFGEGEYDETEQLIQALLEEAGQNVSNTSIENQKYNINAKTPESYLGYARIENFSSPETIKQDQPQNYSFPKDLYQNYFAYSGTWTLEKERAIPQKGANLKLRFNAQKVHLVMRSPKKTQVKVYLDGKLVDIINAGEDVKDGITVISEDRLYTLIKLQSPGDHILNLEFLDDGAELYAFTFS
jgi:cytochrome c biogenesis protein CcdA/thiol-disulfide isomerase/thioredoxin